MKNSLCACEDVNPYQCFADRHNLGICDFEVVEAFGGPCECHCHADEFDDIDAADIDLYRGDDDE